MAWSPGPEPDGPHPNRDTDTPRPAETSPDPLTVEALGRAYLRTLPWAAVVWLAAGAPPGPGAREAFVAALLSILVLAPAAKSLGLHPRTGLLRLVRDRFVTQSLNLLLLLLFVALAAGVGGTVGGMLGDAAGLSIDVVGTVFAALATIPILAWYWPVLALAVVAPEWAGRQGPGAVWRGPGYTAARRLVRDFGSAARTALVLALLYTWMGMLIGVGAYRGDSAFPTVVEAASYGLFFPVVAWLVVAETARMVADAVPGAEGTAAS